MTSASSTEFCFEKLEGPDGRHLWMDGNGKITAGNGTLANPKPNSFSLVQVKDCPYATETCKKACYVHNLEEAQPELHAMYQHNSETIREIFEDIECDGIWMRTRDRWANLMAVWIEKNCIEFRWHVSGDVFSEEYAEWIVGVCDWSPGVTHWIYTRSFPYVAILTKAKNLVVNLSADKDNIWESLSCATRHDLRVCYLTEDGTIPYELVKGDIIFPDYGLRGNDEWFKALEPGYKQMVCPVDLHGKTEKRRCGPCRKCMV